MIQQLWRLTFNVKFDKFSVYNDTRNTPKSVYIYINVQVNKFYVWNDMKNM